MALPRREIWLNPFEAAFRRHLASRLHKMGRDKDWLPIIEAAIRQRPQGPDAPIVLGRIKASMRATQ